MTDANPMASGARKLLEVCAGVQSGESVLVVTDPEKLAIADALSGAATDAGAEVTVAVMATRRQDGHEPPRPVTAAMHAADVIFTPVAISITHTSAIRDACAAGARAVVMTGFTEKMMMGRWPGRRFPGAQADL